MLAIRRQSGELLYLDACTALNVKRTSSVTKNPIDGSSDTVGSFVGDHIVNDNIGISVKGVLSGYDFGIYKNTMAGSSIVNPVTTNTLSNISTTERDIIQGKNVGATLPVSEGYQVLRIGVNESLAFLQEIRKAGEVVSVLVFNSNMLLDQLYPSLVMTEFSTDEDDQTGSSPNLTLSFEQVTIVTAKRVKVNVVEKKAAKNKNSGNKDAKGGSNSLDQAKAACQTKYDTLFDNYEKALASKDSVKIEQAKSALLSAVRKIIPGEKIVPGTINIVRGKVRNYLNTELFTVSNSGAVCPI